jgi:hypothetical protein
LSASFWTLDGLFVLKVMEAAAMVFVCYWTLDIYEKFDESCSFLFFFMRILGSIFAFVFGKIFCRTVYLNWNFAQDRISSCHSCAWFNWIDCIFLSRVCSFWDRRDHVHFLFQLIIAASQERISLPFLITGIVFTLCFNIYFILSFSSS